MKPYEVYMRLELLDIVPRQGRARREIERFIRNLKDQPGTLGDYSEKDLSQRVHQVKLIAGYAIYYWCDAPVHIVMVTDITPADEGHS